MKDTRVILLDVPRDRRFGKEVCRGIHRYARPNRPWLFNSKLPRRWLQNPDTAGLISMRKPEEYIPIAKHFGLAAVGIGAWAPLREFSGLAYVDVDPDAVGEMAADYFIERGFDNFATIYSSKIGYSRAFQSVYRADAFAAALRRRGLTCEIFDPKKRYPPHGEPLPNVANVAEQAHRWVAGLPKPLAIFCIDDSTAFWVCGACWHADIRVPEEVAVLGVEDDDLFCDMSYPPISSIQIPAEQIGFEAAKMLDGMINGRKAPKRPILLPPKVVITRRSTNILAVEEPYIVRAVEFIRENAQRGIRVEEVAEVVSLSRRALERRFRKVLRRSPFEEIRRVQIENIKTLLTQTDITLEVMAPECGFESVSRMSPAFKKATGMSPGVYRKQFRSR